MNSMPSATAIAKGAGSAHTARHALAPRPSAASLATATAPKPRRMPPTIKASLALTSSPRTDAGAISAMYTGAACIENATPRP